MDNSVIIKGYKNGINILLDPKMDFEELKERFQKKIKDSSKFLGNVQVALCFEGRKLSHMEELTLLQIISIHSQLQVICILSEDGEKEAIFQEAIDRTMLEKDTKKEEVEDITSDFYQKEQNNAQFYKGNLRSGQSLDFDCNVVIVGDVNPGAAISSTGSIVVLGALRGIVFAGSKGNEKAFVLAHEMSPVQIRIADVIARAPDSPDKNQDKEPKIAFLEDENIYIEPITKKILSERQVD